MLILVLFPEPRLGSSSLSTLSTRAVSLHFCSSSTRRLAPRFALEGPMENYDGSTRIVLSILPIPYVYSPLSVGVGGASRPRRHCDRPARLADRVRAKRRSDVYGLVIRRWAFGMLAPSSFLLSSSHVHTKVDYSISTCSPPVPFAKLPPSPFAQLGLPPSRRLALPSSHILPS